jgi:hypothetical protein
MSGEKDERPRPPQFSIATLLAYVAVAATVVFGVSGRGEVVREILSGGVVAGIMTFVAVRTAMFRSVSQLSLAAFLVTIGSLILAPLLFAIAMGMAMPRGNQSGNLPDYLAGIASVLAGISIVANIVAWVTGVRAKRTEEGRTCGWIYVDAILFLITVWWLGMLLSM